MADPDDRTDASSIKPVSSLRSRFENLGKEAAVNPASLVAKSPILRAASPAVYERQYPIGKEHGVGSSVGHREEKIPHTPRHSNSVPVRSRPLSMISISQPSPLLVNVDPPNSPGMLSSATPTTIHARTLSRTTTPTPTLEARTPPFLEAAIASKALSDGAITNPSTPELRPKSSAKAPPPVNRAGKPVVPKKPTTLTSKTEALAAPQPTQAELTDQSVSPFSTPPSSGASSPGAPKPSLSQQFVKDSKGSLARLRGDSDASFVERLRADSDASSTGRDRGYSDVSLSASRARAQSHTSFVEPSSLPDTHSHWNLPPPTHHIVAVRREQQANAAKLPARYRPVNGRDGSGMDDPPEQRPRLPSRPELQIRSGRTSPNKTQSGRTSPVKPLVVQRSATMSAPVPSRIPATSLGPRSALNQGFSSAGTPTSAPAKSHTPPAVPAPRRSTDRRREPAPEPPVKAVEEPFREEDDEPARFEEKAQSGAIVGASDYPDSSQASRRPPKYRQRPHHIYTESESRTFAVCGQHVCTTGHSTKAWNLKTGEQLLHMMHNETTKVTSMVFKPSLKVEDEGKRIWLGTNIGEIHEVDIPSQSLVKTKANARPRREIIRMFRHASELWTLDDGGDLNVWKPDVGGALSLDSQCYSFRTPRGHTFSIALGKHLWVATGNDIRVFAPSASSDSEFQVLRAPLTQPGTGDVHSGTTLSGKPDMVYFGHQDGKVSIYNRHEFSCTGVVNVSVYKLSSLTGVGDYLWAGFHTGMIYVYDTSTSPWTVRKDWRAHDKHIVGIVVDRSAIWKLDRLQVVTLASDNMLKIWDGTLEEDWLDSRMKEQDSQYCSFRELTAAVLTWNAGASKPHHLQHDQEDDNFFREYMSTRDSPDIFVFGFQELVDLENKKTTAKMFFKSKKKDPYEQEQIGHQYRAWRDHLTRCLDDYMPASQTYTLLHTASLVGLFTCIFVKSSLRSRIKHVHAAEVKRGMGGHHGNKGALVLRVVLDDSSICFVNCHLAAGQTQTANRNNDIAEILETEALPSFPLPKEGTAQHSDVFTSGGDGSMILDHEICILNGDLNYRIDTMGRVTVVKHIAQNNLQRLLDRDQLLLSRKKNAGNRLRAFQESTITFAPTYKYDLRSDTYDTSEKRRSPAWCDRILYRGLGKVKMDEYRRWELRVSDHRPVSGHLRLRVKTVDEARRARVWATCQQEFEKVRKAMAKAVQIEYLTLVLGLSHAEALAALKV